MSPIPFYLVGGLFFGAGGLIKLDGTHEFAHLSGEIGVILLLLMLGLEYTAAELVTGLRRSWQAGVLDLVLNFLPGAGLAVMLGWGLVGAMVMGGVTYISSSGIAAKVITDLGRIGNRETPAILSILVFEDLAMAIYLPILTAMLAGVSFLGGFQTVGISLAVVTLVLIVALRHGHHVSKAVHSENSEVFLLNLLGALLVAGLAAALQVSAAVGALCSASPSREPRPTAPRGSWSLCGTSLPRSSLWLSGSTPTPPPFRRCWVGRSCWPLSRGPPK
ncbi:K(+)/H(+) antiporter YhaU [Arthrobacter sp. Hiyo6]|nr:K(+)/H(+) antiporter YhaU [Arthrobacter sp. Hiyo6]